MSAKILEGNVLETLKDLPACSVQCVVTSPPYYGLRDYGIDGQIGLEPTPEAYVEVLVTLFREIRRVLKDDGTVWLNLGDSYWGGKGSNANLDKGNEHDKRACVSRKRFPTDTVNGIRKTGYYPMANARDVWHIPTRPYKEAHFAVFPPDLIEPCILAGSKEGDVILDPFNGSGTTGEVAIKYHREYIGCEINPEYIRLTERRLSKIQPVLMQERSLTPLALDGAKAPDFQHSFPADVLVGDGVLPEPPRQ